MSLPSRHHTTPVRMCADCERITDRPILIRSVEQGSGPGWSLYACPGCAPHHLTADEARCLWIEHVERCAPCVTEECPVGSALRGRFVLEPETP